MNQQVRDQWVRLNFCLAMKADERVLLFIGDAVSELGYTLRPQNVTATDEGLHIHNMRTLADQYVPWSRINFVSDKFTFRTDQEGTS